MDSSFHPFLYQNAHNVPYFQQPLTYEAISYSSSSYANVINVPPYTIEDSDPWSYNYPDAGLPPISFRCLPSPSPPYMSPNAPVIKAIESPNPRSSACFPSVIEDQSISDSLEFLQQVIQENSGRPLSITDSLRGTRKTQASHDRRRKGHIAHRCFICGQGFTTKHRVKEHIDAHCGLKRYRAPCGFESSYRHDAKRHSTRCAMCRDHQTL